MPSSCPKSDLLCATPGARHARYQLVVCLVFVLGTDDGLAERSLPEARAVAFLTTEVPRWSRENRCFSCHNNGDAARALYQASRAGYRVPESALADTTRLAEPAGRLGA